MHDQEVNCLDSLWHKALWRYAIAVEMEKGSAESAPFADTTHPDHSVRVVEGGAPGVGDQLLMTGEQHDQGILPEAHTCVYSKLVIACRCSQSIRVRDTCCFCRRRELSICPVIACYHSDC